MIDAIIFVPQFPELVEYLGANHPELLMRDEDGSITQPPVVTGFDRTPAAINGNALMIYARLSEEDADKWRDMPHVEVLASEPYMGKGTGERVYQQIFNDPEKLAKYDSVWSREKEYEDDEGNIIKYEQPYFGIMGGA